MKHFLTLVLCLLGTSLFAQNSAFQDGKGESAYKFSGSAATVNTKDESISLAVNTLKALLKKSNKLRRVGLNLSLGASQGLSSLKDDHGLFFTGSVGVYYGLKKAPPAEGTTDAQTAETYASAGFLLDRSKVYDLGNPSGKIIYPVTNGGWKIEVGRYGYFGDFLWAVAGNGGIQTNSKDIKKQTITTLISTSANDSTTATTQESAFKSSEFVDHRLFFHLNADLAWLMNRKKETVAQIPPIYLALHFRYEAKQYEMPTFNPALGFYAGSVGAPKKIVIGIYGQAIDAFNVSHAQKDLWQRTALNVTAGFSLD